MLTRRVGLHPPVLCPPLWLLTFRFFSKSHNRRGKRKTRRKDHHFYWRVGITRGGANRFQKIDHSFFTSIDHLEAVIICIPCSCPICRCSPANGAVSLVELEDAAGPSWRPCAPIEVGKEELVSNCSLRYAYSSASDKLRFLSNWDVCLYDKWLKGVWVRKFSK